MAGRNGASTRTTPRWVKIQGTFVVLFIVAMIGMSSGLIGRHGSMQHDQQQQMDGR